MVMDNLHGIYSQGKMQCLLRFADIIDITKTDLVCQVETEMFQHKIRSFNPDAPIVLFNGLNGNGTLMLKRMIDEYKDLDEISENGFAVQCIHPLAPIKALNHS